MKKLWDRLRGVSELKDAWFVGTVHHYFGIRLPSALPVSDKGWLLCLGLIAYLGACFAFLARETFSTPLYVASALPGIAAFYLIALPKTCWVTKEKAKELSRWAKSSK
jgi:hypothetical protein